MLYITTGSVSQSRWCQTMRLLVMNWKGLEGFCRGLLRRITDMFAWKESAIFICYLFNDVSSFNVKLGP
jgi:hypothetical protein